MPARVVSKPRVVRVFVSSTFRDMETERDLLAKRAFPELRERCRKRGVEFVDVDLRWGVTREQAERGETLPICLEEIERCRPYFIGLLGERYGWVPDRIDEGLLDRQPWLREHLDQSITELEILHGVLRNPEMAERAYFYFRDPAYVASLFHDEGRGFAAVSPEAASKLKALKQRIRDTDFPVCEDYPDPEAVCGRILDDLWAAIEEEFPEVLEPDPLDREAEEHAAFAHSRARSYIAREEQYRRLDEHAAGDGPPLVIVGESGIGKSALLANWVARYRAAHPDAFVLEHYVGSTPHSTDCVAMLRRIMGEFKRRFSIESDIPDTPEALKDAFPNWLSMAAGRGAVALVLDGLNQLEDRDNAPDLHWLPEYFPSDVRVFLSTLPGRSMDALRKREWPTYEVKSLTGNERRSLIREYLGRYRKSLNPAQIDRVVAADYTGNPLYLRVLLEELRVFGSFEELDRRIDHYLAASTIDALYGLVLERLEADYDRERLDLVRDAASLICVSRRGLAESELLELLGADGERLPQALWSPLYIALRESLVSRSGLITFVHDYLRKAVRRRYLSDFEHEGRIRTRLAGHFENGPLGRKLDEYAYQLLRAKQWSRLAEALCDLDLYEYGIGQVSFMDQLECWRALEGRYDAAPLFQAALEKRIATEGESEDLAILVKNIAVQLNIMGEPRSALPLMELSMRVMEQVHGPDSEQVAAALQSLAVICSRLGYSGRAQKYFDEALVVSERACGPDHLLTATILYTMGQHYSYAGPLFAGRVRSLYDRAIAILEPLEGTMRDVGLAFALNNLGIFEGNHGDRIKAAQTLERALEIVERTLGPRSGEASNILNSLGCAYCDLNQYGVADRLLRRALAITESCFGPRHLETAKVLNSLGFVCDERRKHAEALPLYRRATALRESLLWQKSSQPAIQRLGSDDMLYTDNLVGAYAFVNRDREALGLLEQRLRDRLAALKEVSAPWQWTGLAAFVMAGVFAAEQGKHLWVVLAAAAVYVAALIVRWLPALTGSIGELVAEAILYSIERGAAGRAHRRYAGLERRLARMERSSGMEDAQSAQLLLELLESSRQLGRIRAALRYGHRALKTLERVCGRDSLETSRALLALHGVYYQEGDFEQAMSLLRRALAIQEQRPDVGATELGQTIHKLADAYYANGDYGMAEVEYERALGVVSAASDEEPGRTAGEAGRSLADRLLADLQVCREAVAHESRG